MASAFNDALKAEMQKVVEIPTVYMTKTNMPYEYAPDTCPAKMKKRRVDVPMSLQMMTYLMNTGSDVEIIETFSSGLFVQYLNLQRMYSASAGNSSVA